MKIWVSREREREIEPIYCFFGMCRLWAIFKRIDVTTYSMAVPYE